MLKMTIRARLVASSTLLILLLTGLSLFLRNDIVNGKAAMETGGRSLQQINATLQDSSQMVTSLSDVMQNVSTSLENENQLLVRDLQTSKNLAIVTEALLTFADYKFWLSHLEVSWLIQSEEKTELTREKLDALLKKLEGIATAKEILTLQDSIAALYAVSIEAVYAYVEGNRVLGNKFLVKAQANVDSVEKILGDLSTRLRIESESTKQQTVASVSQSIKKVSNVSSEVNLTVSEMTSAVRVTSKAVEFSDKTLKAAQSASSSSIPILAIALFLAILFTWLITASVTKPLIAISKAMSSLAKGDTEISIPPLNSEDEMGRMASALQVFKSTMEANSKLAMDKVVEELRSNELQLMQSLEMADLLEEKILSSVLIVEDSTEQLHTALDGLTHGANQTSQLSISAQNTSDNMTGKMHDIAGASEELAAAINEISTHVTKSATITCQAVSEAKQSTELVSSLSMAADQIGDIITLIQDIAEQTKLLALNANIEAARAGDAGRGFAIVASEVKVLADQTSEATDKITDQVNALRKATTNASEGIMTIVDTIVSVESVTDTITASIKRQDKATQEIAQSVQEFTKDYMSAASDISAINLSASNAGEYSKSSFKEAKILKENAHYLKTEVNGYLQTLRESIAGNRRCSPRHSFKSSATLRWDMHRKICQTKNLSLSGSLIKTDKEYNLAVGDLIEVELPDIGDFNARVIRNRPTELALEFTGLTTDDIKLLQVALEGLNGPQPEKLPHVA